MISAGTSDLNEYGVAFRAGEFHGFSAPRRFNLSSELVSVAKLGTVVLVKA